ncbi:MAG: tRNA (adenosine(37)-N6)-threonylcarbamoyltransferase complex dimerization subunit type 1 TsaB [Deltaproteobacteria bacterium]|nr:tRNA (adenosine(37)-N6)-threonylcarbamoyltransferase complex dimerization subunit type 1 TsaB [Deltaproteobacteria bacterium]
MLVIAIETATMAGSIAIVDDARVISEITLNIRATHSEKLMPAIDRLLGDSGLAIDDMDGVAVSIGPGSFTGLRIGLSAAKGLSYASGKPLIGIPTLDALALNMTFSSYLICPIQDARKGEVYTALYGPGDNSPGKISDDIAVNPDALEGMITEKTVFLGDGVNRYRDLLMAKLGGLYYEAPLPLQLPRASNVALLALNRLEKGDTDDPFTMIPRYIRKSEAEIRCGENRGRPLKGACQEKKELH